MREKGGLAGALASVLIFIVLLPIYWGAAYVFMYVFALVLALVMIPVLLACIWVWGFLVCSTVFDFVATIFVPDRAIRYINLESAWALLPPVLVGGGAVAWIAWFDRGESVFWSVFAGGVILSLVCGYSGAQIEQRRLVGRLPISDSEKGSGPQIGAH